MHSSVTIKKSFNLNAKSIEITPFKKQAMTSRVFVPISTDECKDIPINIFRFFGLSPSYCCSIKK